MKETRMIEASKMMPFTNTKIGELNSGSAKPSWMMPPNLTPREVLMSVLAIEFMRRTKGVIVAELKKKTKKMKTTKKKRQKMRRASLVYS
jgi:hypothetical protein